MNGDVKIASHNVLLPGGTKPLLGPMLTHTYGTILLEGHNKLIFVKITVNIFETGGIMMCSSNFCNHWIKVWDLDCSNFVFHYFQTWRKSYWPGTRFTNDFSITIQITWHFHLAVSSLLVNISLPNSAHATPAQLPCNVQNFVAITFLEFRWAGNKIAITFELWRENS